MRILLLSHLFPKASDPQSGVFTLRQALNLRSLGIEVDIISHHPYAPRWLTLFKRWRPYRNQGGALDAGGFEVHRIPYFRPPGKWFMAREGLAVWLAIRSTVRRLMAARKYDLVYAWDFRGDVAAGCRAAEEMRVPCVGLAIGADLNVYVGFSSQAARIVRDMLLRCDRVVCVSQALCGRVAELTSGKLHADCVTTGTDVTRFAPANKTLRRSRRREFNIPVDGDVVLYLGYLKREKGIFELVEAFEEVSARHEQAILVIAGTGPDKEEFQARLAESPVRERIVCLGQVAPDRVPDLCQTADILTLPSYHEGMPNCVFEGMATGLPILATSVGGIPEVVSESEGVLIPPQDATALAEAMGRMLADESGRIRMGQSGRRLVEREYSSLRMAERLKVIFEETIDQYRREHAAGM